MELENYIYNHRQNTETTIISSDLFHITMKRKKLIRKRFTIVLPVLIISSSWIVNSNIKTQTTETIRICWRTKITVRTQKLVAPNHTHPFNEETLLITISDVNHDERRRWFIIKNYVLPCYQRRTTKKNSVDNAINGKHRFYERLRISF